MPWQSAKLPRVRGVCADARMPLGCQINECYDPTWDIKEPGRCQDACNAKCAEGDAAFPRCNVDMEAENAEVSYTSIPKYPLPLKRVGEPSV